MNRFARHTSVAVVVSLLMVVLVAQPAPVRGASPSAGGSSDYEIPLSDLKKVEKKKSIKQEGRRRREKKKQNAEQESSPDVSGAPGHAESAPRESGKESAPVPQALQQQAAGDGVRIIHEPNSYVVVGKRTVIMAIISSGEPLKSVGCQFRAAVGAEYVSVSMIKEQGRQYTYSATLPPLAQDVQSLRYRFAVVDSLGKETVSREFVIPVKPSAVVPGDRKSVV